MLENVKELTSLLNLSNDTFLENVDQTLFALDQLSSALQGDEESKAEINVAEKVLLAAMSVTEQHFKDKPIAEQLYEDLSLVYSDEQIKTALDVVSSIDLFKFTTMSHILDTAEMLVEIKKGDIDGSSKSDQ